MNVRNDSGHVNLNYSHSTLQFPDDSQWPGVEVRDQEDRPAARHLGPDAAGHLFLDERTGTGPPTRGQQLD